MNNFLKYGVFYRVLYGKYMRKSNFGKMPLV
nr:MAG TPA: hypothetical protein [Caudoviricetes sp.]